MSKRPMALWVVYASTKTATNEPKEVGKLVEDINRAVQALKERPEAARQVFDAKLKVVDTRTRDQIVKNLRTVLADKVYPNPADVEKAVDAMRAVGLVRGEVQLLSPGRLK